MLDCFDGALASWSIGTSPNADLANSSLRVNFWGKSRKALIVGTAIAYHSFYSRLLFEIVAGSRYVRALSSCDLGSSA